ncbi:MAG: hypothetical protein K2X82_14900 [Gemmataceae bacterium]|nr:hypothetical protein [Gemmataceae bacterium]
MSIDITDPQTAAQLAAAREVGDLWGPDGQLLGRFVPIARMDLPQLTEEDYDRMERLIADPNTKWVTPEDVMARLREIDRCGR